MNTSSRSALIAATMLLSALNVIPQHAEAQSGEVRLTADEPLILADSNEDEQQRLNPQQLRPYANDYEYQQHQQQESNQANAPMGQSQVPYYQGASPQLAPRQSGAGTDALEAARKDWQRKPSLPAAQNPLLGKWARPASSRSNSSDPFAQLGAMMKGGLCEVLFGGDGVFEFRPYTLVGIDQGMREQELDQVEYRGGAHRVAVIPKSTLKLMVFDFDGPNRINWAGQNCVLVRVGPASKDHRAGTADAGTDAGTLTITAGISQGDRGFTPVADREMWVLKESAEVILSNAGVKSSNYGSVLQIYAQVCQYHFPICEHGMREIKAHSVGKLKTDAAGSARSAPLPIRDGEYYVFGDFVLDNRVLMWNVPIRLKAGANGLTLDQRNATSSN